MTKTDAPKINTIPPKVTDIPVRMPPMQSNDLKRSPGKQPGAQGFWRSEPPVPEQIVPHYPTVCTCCGNTALKRSGRPHMGFYVYELEKTDMGIRIRCTLKYCYGAVCECGHETKARPGEGVVSKIEGHKNDLKLTEDSMVGPMLVSFICALSVRHKMSRVKIRDFFSYWPGPELSVGTIDKSVRKTGVACSRVVEKLLDELQQKKIVHLDETPWYEKEWLKWLWVVISNQIAVFHIGSRKKDALLELLTEAFWGWLVTDGYMAYRSYEKRQRCLAHLIRKAIALTGAVGENAQKMGEWLLRELRGLIKAVGENGEGGQQCNLILARLKRVCKLGSEEEHENRTSLTRLISACGMP